MLTDVRIPRIYTPQALTANQTFVLEAAASRHLLTVLRLQPGAPLLLFDGTGNEFEARLDAVDHQAARVTTGNARANRSESPLRITLAQGLARGARMDYTLQKAVELGVAEIIPVVTARSVVRLDAQQAARKHEHWQQLVISACEQSGRVRIPAVQAPTLLKTLLVDARQAALRLLLDPDAESALGTRQAPTAGITLLIGPEGGLSTTEIAAAVQAGFQRVRLGPRILRTETAALVALSVLQARWGDLAA